MTKKGKFIVFEGIDGSGKSTLVKKLSEKMIAQNQKVYATAEPTNSPIGSVIRNVLNRRIKMDEQTIAALFLADRLDHIKNEANGMLQFLEKGTSVVSDRYYFSSYAYHRPHVSLDWVIAANAVCAELLQPDVIFFIDVSVEESLQRIRQNRAGFDLFETESRLTAVRNYYLEAIEKLKDKEKVIFINGAQKVEEVFADVWEKADSLLS